MTTFKRKSLFAAIGGLVAVGAAGTANAVYVNTDGLGQALVYPYYTVRSNTDTLMSVVNSTASAKLVKVRFLESQNSKEVLDFNLWLSAFDVWTGAISATADGAKIGTTDKSCTTPPIPAGGQAFRNLLFTEANADKSLDRTREGYIEILEMATLLGGGSLETAVTHVNGVPTCAGLPGNTITAAQFAQLLPPTGGLFGTWNGVNVPAGTSSGGDAVAFDQWSVTPRYTGPGDITPTLADAVPAISTVVNRTSAYTSTWTSGANAVSATIMHDQVFNEYVIDPGLKAGTDWIVTMPTKRFYVAPGTGAAVPPFQRNFDGVLGSCDDITLAYYDREERKPGQTVDFSPSASPAGPQLCWEANVITFGSTNVLASAKSRNIDPKDPVTGATYGSGWAVIGFASDGIVGASGVHKLAAPTTTILNLATGGVTAGAVNVTYFGLPTIGVGLQNFVNGAAGTPPTLSNYTSTFGHKFTRLIVAPVPAN